MLARLDVSYHRTPAALVESMSQWLRGILGARRGPEFKQVVLILRLIAVCGQGTSSLDPGNLLNFVTFAEHMQRWQKYRHSLFK